MTSAIRPTAKIIAFPKRGRLGFHFASGQTAANTSEAPVFDCFGSWYHEEAVREAAKATRKP